MEITERNLRSAASKSPRRGVRPRAVADAPQPEAGGAEPADDRMPSMQDVVEYQRDFFERSILFWDTLRRRADNMLAHERAGMPPLLDFKYETLLDGRGFESPANYALLRMVPELSYPLGARVCVVSRLQADHATREPGDHAVRIDRAIVRAGILAAASP